MKAFMVLGVLVGVMAMLAAHISVDTPGEDRLVALNYVMFRQAAFLHAHKYKPQAGEIAHASLHLPIGWRALRSWKARVQDGHLYVYGPASAEEIEEARRLLRKSRDIGRAENGRLAPQWGDRIPIPGFVPEDSLVSVIEVG